MTAQADLLDRLPDAVVAFDPDGRLLASNRRARMLLGDHAPGTDIAVVLPVVNESGSLCDDAWLREGPVGQRLAETTVRLVRDGRQRAYSLTGERDDAGLVVTLRTAGRRLAHELANSDLIATVSHEIRSPLTSVKGFTSTMLRRWDRFSDEQKRTMLETINHDADRVTRLLKELLAVSRIDAGRVEVNRQRMDVVAALQGLLERMDVRDDIGDRTVTLEAPDDVRKAWVDPDKLLQVLTNLLDNAVKYGDHSDIRVAVTDTDRGIGVAVADDGPGIAPDQQKRIFEKFGRGRESRRAGTGLGLYISRGLVQAMGGSIECESTVGVGTTFRLWVPPSDV